MPKRTDIHTILVIGAGPIVIGQACEFDYAGTQACLALRQEGYRVILVNSNPATIMTDPEFSDKTYIEPLTVDSLTQIIARERPCAILPTMGGQTALNLAVDLEKNGILAQFKVQLIGATIAAIQRAEDRTLFRKTMTEIGLCLPKSARALNFEEALLAADTIGFPLIIRPSFTLGGSGCGIANGMEDFHDLCTKAFQASPVQELLIDEALIGWKEFEMEVVRDKKDNCIIVCSIENFDPLGIHTGDSITVAPALTLTDKEYQKMRTASFAVLRAIGVETGGSNVQFAIHPHDGRLLVIEMNPRVSRSSALASKATGFPIAKIAAKLAVGYTLDELSCDITGDQIPASYEPVLDYVVVKIPRHQFEKFPDVEDRLGPQMFAVGEVMAIGRTFSEALLKAMRSMETRPSLAFSAKDLATPTSKRLWHIFSAFRRGFSVAEIHALTFIDPWFLQEIADLVAAENEAKMEPDSIAYLKRLGFSDYDLAKRLGLSEQDFRKQRLAWGIKPVFKHVDSCAAEFSTPTSYAYATYEEACEIVPSTRDKIVILGSGANRIGQGIEFDYSCVHAVNAFKELGFETIMINCNPETVSTDFEWADRLYFSPLSIEDILPILEKEKPVGICCQFGGQTPLNLAKELQSSGAKLLGLDMAIVDLCEDRARFRQVLEDLDLKQPDNITLASAYDLVPPLSYPVILRPSFVLGGRGMLILENESDLQNYLKQYFSSKHEHPILVEKFLSDAIEIDVDAISDGTDVFIPHIMEQVEAAGVHSGDSAAFLPTLRLSLKTQALILEQTKKLAIKLAIKGLLNIQFAVQGDTIYVLELNPRASRSVPFLSKALGLDLVKIAVRCVMGETLKTQGLPKTLHPKHYFVKQAVFSSAKLPTGPLGPEMKSTGEVMGIAANFADAYAKAQTAAGTPPKLPQKTTVLSLQEVYHA